MASMNVVNTAEMNKVLFRILVSYVYKVRVASTDKKLWGLN